MAPCHTDLTPFQLVCGAALRVSRGKRHLEGLKGGALPAPDSPSLQVVLSCAKVVESRVGQKAFRELQKNGNRVESPTAGRSIHTHMPYAICLARSFTLQIRCGALAEYHSQLTPCSGNDKALQNMENVERHRRGGRSGANQHGQELAVQQHGDDSTSESTRSSALSLLCLTAKESHT